MYWRCHQRPVSQRRFLHPPSASASVTNRTRTPQDNNENQYENAMGTEERGDRDNEDGDDHHHHADDGWSDDDDDLLSDEDQHQQESAVSPSVGGVRESGPREISGIGRLGIGRGRGRGGSRHQEQNPQWQTVTDSDKRHTQNTLHSSSDWQRQKHYTRAAGPPSLCWCDNRKKSHLARQVQWLQSPPHPGAARSASQSSLSTRQLGSVYGTQFSPPTCLPRSMPLSITSPPAQPTQTWSHITSTPSWMANFIII